MRQAANALEPVHLVEDGETGDRFLIYATNRGLKVELRYEGDTLWATQKDVANIFQVSRSSATLHLRNIFSEGELVEEAVCKECLLTAADGKQYRTKLYNLHAIISVGYRVSSKQGTLFRMWATDKLVQFAIKGFVIDAERLKNPAEHDRFAELRRIIQDIRASEANVYAELRRILAMCSDYDHKSGGDFFATFQNKLHFAVTGMTAAEILLDRADASKPNMALTNWPKDEIRKQDVTIAKNYLYEVDMSGLNRVTSMLLDYFEDQVERQRLVSTAAAENWLDKWLLANDRAILPNKGRVAAKDAKDHAHRQYAVFDERRRANRKQQADAELAALRTEVKKLPKPHKKDRP